jgi:hypothetical protein
MTPPTTEDSTSAPGEIGCVMVHNLRDDHVALDFHLREKSCDQAGIDC